MKDKLRTILPKKKLLIILVLLFVILSISTSVKALTISQSGGLFTYIHHGADVAENYYVTAIKKDSSGRYAYCLEHDKQLPQGEEFAKIGTDKGLTYILLNGFPNKSFTRNEQKDYYITQASIHLYRGEIQWLYGSDVKDPYGLLPYIKDLVNGARNYSGNSPEINVSNNVTLTDMGAYYETNTFSITKKGDMQSYDVLNVPQGIEVINKTDSSFKLRIPKSLLEGKTELNVNKIRIRGNFGVIQANEYTSSIVTIQKLTILENQSTEVFAKDSISFSIKVPVGYIEIYKKDADYSNINLSGVKYEIRDNNNNLVETVTTNINGYVKSKALPTYGKTYTVKEISTKSDYILDTKPVSGITLNENETKTLNLTNKKKQGNLKIYKVDKDNHKITLGNVDFNLYSEEFQKVIGTYTTNVNGELEIKNLRIGTYILKETKTNKWYNLAKDTNIEVKWNETTKVTVENELKKGQVKIVKVDKENNEIKLQGVKFKVMDKNGNTLEELTTDKNGEVFTKKYALRDFDELKIQEVETLKGYSLNTEIKTIRLEEGQIKAIKFENEIITTTINPHKKDRDTSKPLSGAEFDIYKDTNENGVLDEEDKIIYHTITKEDGYSEDIKLYYGTYFVKEVVAPEGYTLDHVINTFTVTELNQKIDVNFADKIIENEVKIIKTAKNDSTTLGIKKGEGVPNTTFRIYIRNEDGSQGDFYKEVTTGEDGTITVTLPYGKYIIKEVKPNDLFLNDSDDQFLDVTDDGVKVDLGFSDTAVNLELDISKTGIIQAQPNDEIRYDFPTLENKSNVALDDFTWFDHLPYDYVKITKLFTGTYNEDLNYKVFYKTNKNDWTQFGDTYNTLVNNCIDFTTLNLDNKTEYITDFKVVFGTVKAGFKPVETPFIFTIVDEDVKPTDKWVNRTKLTGNYTDENGNKTELEDNDNWETISYGKKLNITTLPRTGTEENTLLKTGLLTVSSLGIIIVLVEMRKKKEE